MKKFDRELRPQDTLEDIVGYFNVEIFDQDDISDIHRGLTNDFEKWQNESIDLSWEMNKEDYLEDAQKTLVKSGHRKIVKPFDKLGDKFINDIKEVYRYNTRDDYIFSEFMNESDLDFKLMSDVSEEYEVDWPFDKEKSKDLDIYHRGIDEDFQISVEFNIGEVLVTFDSVESFEEDLENFVLSEFDKLSTIDQKILGGNSSYDHDHDKILKNIENRIMNKLNKYDSHMFDDDYQNQSDNIDVITDIRITRHDKY